MQTGFLGTKYLLPVLTRIGRSDLAYKLLVNTDFPGWGYEVVNGATTIWERWNSYTREDGFGQHNAGMNSFNHYAFGAVCAWMFGQMAGIEPATPGFEKIVFRPELERLSHIGWVQATYHSYHGPIGSAWRLIDNGAKAELTFRLPANTTAVAYIPCTSVAAITEGGHPLGHVQGVKLLGVAAGRAKIGLASGTYHFSTELPPAIVQGLPAP
jgi:alpha-L-rhamnosidase